MGEIITKVQNGRLLIKLSNSIYKKEAAMAAAAASMSSTQTNGVERASLYNMEGAPERTSATAATTSTAPMAGYTKGLYQSTEDE